MKKKLHWWQTSLISGLIIVLLSLGLATPSAAHWADLAVAEIMIKENKAEMTLTLPTGFLKFADDNQDQQLSSDEVSKHQKVIEDFLAKRVTLTNQTKNPEQLLVTSLPPIKISSNTQTHSTILLSYTWTEPISALTINYDLFAPNITTAQCLATIFYQGKSRNFVFTPENQELFLTNNQLWQQASSFSLLGIKHILTGYDHILFLISLMLGSSGLFALIKMVTAFTIAHSLTLSLAVLKLVSLPTMLVESAIALTIVYVAAENLIRKNLQQRWLFAFGFGLIHGLGFAGILQETPIDSANLAISLGSFNIGVEIGQIIIVSLIFTLLQTLNNYAWQLQFKRSVSFSLIAIGSFWFIQRAF